MALDVGVLGGSILGAFKSSFTTQWPQIETYAEGESERLAHSLVQITTLRVNNKITDGECSVMLEMQKNATRTVFLALEGLSLILVETAINAALTAVQTAVNSAIGFALL